MPKRRFARLDATGAARYIVLMIRQIEWGRWSVGVRIAAIVCALLLGLGTAAAAESSTPAQLDADLDQMLAWFTGRFDSFAQAREDEENEVEEPHGRIHSIFAPVDLPAIGEHVFYVEQYSDGDPTKIYRQRLYRFEINAEHGDVELVIFALPDPAAAVGAHQDPAKLAGLTIDNLKAYPGCEVHWTRHGRDTADDRFEGIVPKGACVVTSSRSGRTLIIMDDLRLDAEGIWIQDRAVDPDGEWVYGHRGGIPHKLKRVHWYDCWAAAPKGEGPDAEWDLWRPIALHNQGGRYAMTPSAGGEARYTAELFQATYQGERSVEVLELAIREAGKVRSIAYAWADPSSPRVGINLRYLQIGCTLDPERRW